MIELSNFFLFFVIFFSCCVGAVIGIIMTIIYLNKIWDRME